MNLAKIALPSHKINNIYYFTKKVKSYIYPVLSVTKVTIVCSCDTEQVDFYHSLEEASWC